MALPVPYRPEGVKQSQVELHEVDGRGSSGGEPLPIRLKIDKNELLIRSLCEWCMKRTRRLRRKSESRIRMITKHRLERRARSISKNINLEKLPEGWLECLKNEHGVLVEWDSYPLSMVDDCAEETESSMDSVCSENFNMVSSTTSNGNGLTGLEGESDNANSGFPSLGPFAGSQQLGDTKYKVPIGRWWLKCPHTECLFLSGDAQEEKESPDQSQLSG